MVQIKVQEIEVSKNKNWKKEMEGIQDKKWGSI